MAHAIAESAGRGRTCTAAGLAPRAAAADGASPILTTVAVALAVAATSVAGYVTLRYSLYDALDQELVDIATSLAVPAAGTSSDLGGLTERALRAGNISSPASARTARSSTCRDERRTSSSARTSWLSPGCSRATRRAAASPPTASRTAIVAVPITELGDYALVLGRPLEATNRILSSLWLVLIVVRRRRGASLAAVAGATVARSSLRPVASCRPRWSTSP